MNHNNKIDFNKKYCIHPAYIIKPDKYRAIITNSKGYETIPYPVDDVNTSFCWIMHPIYAVVFSFFDGKNNLSDIILSVSNELNISQEKAQDMIIPYINNTEQKMIHYIKSAMKETDLFPCNYFPVPKYFIIECEKNPRHDLYPKESFYIKKDLWNFDNLRLSSPITLTLMLNNRCITDCIYCYCNKKHDVKQPLSTGKILDIIKEADKIGVVSFELAGGEILLHPDIEIILSNIYKHGYINHLSTKLCLSEKQILTLKKIGINSLQVSVDAWNTRILQETLNVKEGYFNNLQKSLRLLEKHEINVCVKSVITHLNTSLKDIDLLLNNLIEYKNIKYISVAPAECSLYKNFDTFKTSAQTWEKISDYVTRFGEKYSSCEIRSQGYLSKTDFINDVEQKEKLFNARGACSGNFSNLYILPDGKVTICEELYWHPKFIVGDVNKQTIQEVWDSREATDLYNLSRKDFCKNSACKYCPDFKECRLRLGVCWKMILQAYGMDNWQLPDPRCPLAPPPINECYR
jgi:radical SAM protein with 4Fe4S-binding SPASM domain